MMTWKDAYYREERRASKIQWDTLVKVQAWAEAKGLRAEFDAAFCMPDATITAEARRLRREKTRARILWCVWPTAILAFAALMWLVTWGMR